MHARSPLHPRMADLGIHIVIVITTPTSTHEYSALVRAEMETTRMDPTARFHALTQADFPTRIPGTSHAELQLLIPDGRRFPLHSGGRKLSHRNGLLQFDYLNVFLTNTIATPSGPPCGFQIAAPPLGHGARVRALFEAVAALHDCVRLKRTADAVKKYAAIARAMDFDDHETTRKQRDTDEARADQILALLPGKERIALEQLETMCGPLHPRE
jgi:hypothetical protein